MALILGNKILSVGVVCFLTIGCSDNAGSYTSYSSDSKAGTIVENPYSSGSGHYAGYEWASKKGASSCGGNSSSFIAGCETYLEQVNQ